MFSLREHGHGSVAVMTPVLFQKAESHFSHFLPIEAFPPGASPQTSHSSARSSLPVELMDKLSGLFYGEPNFLFRAPDENELSTAVSKGRLMPSDVEDSAGLPTFVCGSSVRH